MNEESEQDEAGVTVIEKLTRYQSTVMVMVHEHMMVNDQKTKTIHIYLMNPLNGGHSLSVNP